MKKLYLCAAILAAAAIGCKKTGSGNGGGGSDTGTFQPTSNGSTWSYSVYEGFHVDSSLLLSEAVQDTALHLSFPTIDTTYTLNITATSADTTIAGVSYTWLQSSDATTGNLLAGVQTDSLYWGLGIIPEFEIPGLGGTLSPQPFLYMKDGPVGESWTQTVYGPSPQGGTDTIVYTMQISAVNQTRMVSGTNYSNVTEETVSVLPGGIDQLANALGGAPPGISLAVVGYFYFARNVGLIEVDIKAAAYGFTYLQTLTSSSIK